MKMKFIMPIMAIFKILICIITDFVNYDKILFIPFHA